MAGFLGTGPVITSPGKALLPALTHDRTSSNSQALWIKIFWRLRAGVPSVAIGTRSVDQTSATYSYAR